MIKAEIVADSKNIFGDRLTTFVVTFPRIILAELNTHRIFSRNSASSRAIPTRRMIEMLQNNPFVPMAWQKEHTGMQGTEYITDPFEIKFEEIAWLADRDYAVSSALARLERKVSKQIINRQLEPFMWHTAMITASNFDNFFDLRSPDYKPDFDRAGSYKSIKNMAAMTAGKSLYYTADDRKFMDGMECTFVQALHAGLNKGAAEIHIMALAEAMWDAMNDSIPNILQPGKWHIPYESKINEATIRGKIDDAGLDLTMWEVQDLVAMSKVKLATAMAARTSYTTVGEEKEISYETLIRIHDKMVQQRPFHASPFEHCAISMNKTDMDQNMKIERGIVYPGWCRNFKGFIQYRATLDATT